ncbi:MAG: SBBP repeat-containing protein [Bacteroidota bacterium]
MLFPCFLLASLASAAQPPLAWIRSHNGPMSSTDNLNAMVIDAQENVYVTGGSTAPGSSFDFTTIKYSSSGVPQWTAVYNGSGNDVDAANALAVDNSGNVYVTGRSRGMNTNEDITTIKYSSYGVQQWVAVYNGTDNLVDEGTAIAVDNAGNVYVTGYVSMTGTSADIITIKYDANGNQQFIRIFNGTGNGNDEGRDIRVDGSGNVYVTGKGNETTSSTLSDIVTIKYDNAGNQQWVMAYDGAGDNDYGKAMTLDNNGNVIVTGYSFLSGYWFDYATIKYSPSGTQLWATRYNHGANRYDEAWDVVADTAGNIYVTGQSQALGGNSAQPDYATVKYNPSGIQQWVARYSSTGNQDDRAFRIALDDQQQIYVTGYTSAGLGNRNFATVKYDTAGVQQWILTYTAAGSGMDVPTAIALTPSGSIYVAGSSDLDTTSSVNEDYLVMRYALLTGAYPLNNPVSLQVFPNPAAAGTKVAFNCPGSAAEMILYDMAGRELKREELYCNTGLSVLLETCGLKPGTYLLHLLDTDGRAVARSRLILQ